MYIDVCTLLCRNGGTPNMDCTACNCPEGYEGTLCQSKIDPCTINASSAECLAQGMQLTTYIQ